MIRPIGFEISDLIQVWIGLAVSLSAIFAWLTYRIAKGGFFMSLPHVDVRASSSGPQRNFAWIRLLGPNTEQWKIAKVSIVSPRAVHFVRRIDTQDDHGGGS